VEDNPGDALLIREALAECGKNCIVTFADTTDAAKSLLNSQTFDLVVSDMGTRSEGGAHLIEAIRSNPRLATVPIVILSGSANSKPAYDAGANAFITKPMDLETYFAKIKALMHFWLEVVELPSKGGN